MKNSIKNLLFIEIIMFIAILSNFFISNVFNNYVYILFLFIILGIIILIYGIDLRFSVKQKRVLINILIALMIYFLVTYITGLFIGFNRTIYTFSLTNLTKNILPTALIIILMEFIRYELIKKSANNKLIVILSCIILALFEISINFKFYDFSVSDDVYEFVGLIVFASISKNIFLTVQCIYTDYLNNIIYRLIMELYIYLVPIVPAFGPYVNSVILIAFPVILCFLVYASITIKKEKKPNSKNRNNIIYYIVFAIMAIILGLNSGFFKYQTLTIGSNSMKPYMSKGDVIIVEKLSDKEIKNIKKGDLLIFRYDNKIISHRVYQVIKRDDGVYFRTKGDNNDQVDATIINTKSVIGVSNIRIKYIGLPSVWLQELFK